MQTRTYVFQGGTSHKFWAVATDGPTLVTRWGRVGTQGQEKRRAFETGDAAAAAAARLVDEKLRKGYVHDADHPLRLAPGAAPPSDPAPRAARAAAAPAPIAPVPADGTAVVLTPQERALPSWLPLGPPLTRSTAPLDLDEVRRGLRLAGEHWGWWRWSGRPFGDDVSPAAAAFWLRVACYARDEHHSRKPSDALAQEIEQGLDVELSRADVLRLVANTQLPSACRLPATLALVPAEEIAQLLADEFSGGSGSGGYDLSWDFAARARSLLLPLLSEADRASLREAVARRVRAQVERDPESAYGPDLMLAGAFGMHEEIEAALATWRDGYLSTPYYGGLEHYTELLGLPNAERFVEETERLGLDMAGDEGVTAWLAATGTDRLDWFARTLARAGNRELAAETARAVFSRVHHPAMAPVALAALGSRAPGEARAWLDAHPAESVTGLAPLLTRRGTVGEEARDELARLLRTPATREAAHAAAAGLDGSDAERVAAIAAAAAGPRIEQESTPPWLDADELASGRLPGWLDPAALPPLLIDGAALREQDVARLLRALKASDDVAHPAVVALRTAADPVSRDAFAWALLRNWIAAAAPSRDGWALLGAGRLGGDRTAQRLTPLIRAWPGEGQHKRAAAGLRALRAIGSDTALMLLNGIAQRVKFKALRDAARAAMEEIADERGMSRDALEDRIVPDAGLDESGTRVFDYGARRFAFALGPDLKPMVRDERGRLRAGLPAPGARDDAELAAAAREQWKEMRRTVADTVRVQTARLEDAMVTQRDWSAADFRAHLAGHPLMRQLVRLLVLAATAPDGTRRTFRLTEEGELADAHDEPLALAGDERVSIVHPLQLDADERDAWAETLAADEVIPPFPQLGRRVLDVEPAELRERDLTRFAGARLPPRAFTGVLDRHGWTREDVADAGIYSCHVKQFPAAGVTAAIQYDGIPIGSPEDAEPQSVEHCFVVAGDAKRAWAWGASREAALRWEEVDPLVRSEVLAVVDAIAAKAAEQ